MVREFREHREAEEEKEKCRDPEHQALSTNDAKNEEEYERFNTEVERLLVEHPPTAEDVQRIENLLTDVKEGKECDSEDGKDDPYVAAARQDLLVNPPTSEESRERQRVIDELEAQNPLPSTEHKTASNDHITILADAKMTQNIEDTDTKNTIEPSAHNESPETKIVSLTERVCVTPIQDTAILDTELDRFPHIRERSDYPHLRATCEKYFEMLKYRDGLANGEITIGAIAEAVDGTDGQVRRWIIKGVQPYLLRVVDNERIKAAVIEQLQQSEKSRTTPTDTILRAADDCEFRGQLLPTHILTPKAVETLLSFRKDAPDPTAFINIMDLQTYKEALRAFPLIQSYSHFDDMHHQVQIYFQLRDNTHLRPDGKLPITALAKYTSIPSGTIHDWLFDTSRPRLLDLLEQRAASLVIHQKRAAELRELDNGIRTIDDLINRLSSSHFMFDQHLQASPNSEAARHYFALLDLIEGGYHPRDLETHFNLGRNNVVGSLRNQHRPYFIQLAANIPKESPGPNSCWLPTTTSDSNIPARYIKSPLIFNDWRQIIPILEQLPTPNNPDNHLTRQLQPFGTDSKILQQCSKNFEPGTTLLEKWRIQFGPIDTLESKMKAFFYLVGASISDGTIERQATFSSQFRIRLSAGYSWSQGFGDRVAYYWTSLGIHTKPGPDVAANPPERPHADHYWYSVNSPFITWVNEAVLGLEPGQTHTYNPVNIDWVLDAPRALQIKILQGLFDGDGWSSVSHTQIGIASGPNADIIKQLLLRVGIEARENVTTDSLLIRKQDSIRKCVELPLFLSATERQEKAEKIVEMIDCTRPESETVDNLPLIRRILELGDNLSLNNNQIRMKIYKEFGITISPATIGRIIKQGDERLKIDQEVVQTFFRVLELQQQTLDATSWQVAKHAYEETGTAKSLSTLTNWLNRHVPRDVRRALSDGYSVSHELLQAYPHLRQYIPEE